MPATTRKPNTQSSVLKNPQMEVYVEGSIAAIPSKNNELNRRSANYQPSIWGDHFLAYASDVKENIYFEERKLQEPKEEVRKMLLATPDKSKQKLNLINTIQRLGLSYHFESEIEASLLYMYNSYHELCDEDGQDLYTFALRFRLLRQQGHYVSCDVFNKFKNPEGNFKDCLVSDVRGMLSLYEAANFQVHGEDILEEALRFTTTHLENLSPNLSKSLASQVNDALKVPIRKTLTRLGARKFISLYQEDQSRNEVLLNFAKLDFNMLQNEHKKELGGITKWWKGIDCAKNLPFTRDRLVECYFWILGVHFEPKYCFARRTITKVIALASIFDDVYDLYGTLDELILFTDSIERWHISALDQLPSYMKHCYRALLDVYSETEEELAKEGRADHVNYAKSEMKKLIRAYFQEAQWFHSGHVPSFEEYMKTALVTGGYMMLASTSFVCMGANKDALDWVSNEPLIVGAASVICRLMDDLVTYEVEQERGELASAVECYINQYGVSKQEAFDHLQKQVTDAWKDINKECLNPTPVPMPLLERILNLSRVMHLLYKDGDGYTNSSTKLKDSILSVLVDPVTI